jgi:DNA-binding transcriptional LysR family regulator
MLIWHQSQAREAAVELNQVKAFLVLAEELHFGRTAERLYLSQPRVSRLVSSLETELGGMLFERTSRQVRLTPLGGELDRRLRPVYAQLLSVIEDVGAAARGTSGLLRLGVTTTTGGPALSRLLREFEAPHPDCEVRIDEVDIFDPYAALRQNDLDVLVNWLVVDEQDLTVGPAIDHRRRVLAVAIDHRLAARSSISLGDLADEAVIEAPPTFPNALYDALIPATASGKPIRRVQYPGTFHEYLTLVARGRIVHPTVEAVPLLGREDIVLVPFHDLPPLALGLIWCSAHENGRIRALSEVARSLEHETQSPHRAPANAFSERSLPLQ